MVTMLTAEDVAATSFVNVDVSWPTARAQRVVDALAPTHVVCRRHETDATAFLLYSRYEFEQLLERADGGTSVDRALDAAARKPTPAVDAAASAQQLPSRCVVHRAGKAIGFVDVPRRRRRRGARRSGGPGAPTHAGAPTADVTTTTARHTLVAELPEHLLLEHPASLLVHLSHDPDSTMVPDEHLPVAVAAGTDVTVVVQARSGVTVRGRAEAELTVPTDGDSQPVRFEIVGDALGPAQVDVLAFVDSRCIGMIKLRLDIRAADEAAPPSRALDTHLAPAIVRLPDLTLLVLERGNGAGHHSFDVRLVAADPALGLTYQRFEPVTLRKEPKDYFVSFFDQIDGFALDTDRQRRTAQMRLEAKGANLFSALFDEPLRELLWSLRERISSVQVLSEEPWIPWELCRLGGTDDGGRYVDGPFFGEQFAITRWISGAKAAPRLSLHNIALVQARHSGLPHAAAEATSIKALASGERTVHEIPSNFIDVVTALASGAHDCWHFTGHGEFRQHAPEQSAIYLAGDDPMTPDDISGQATNLGQATPLVFLNACQVGRGAMSLTRMGGWATQFLHAGAGAFIGSYWSIYDDVAHTFATTLYRELLAGTPVGVAARAARRAINTDGDPTWMAYTVFADPYATVS